MLYGRLSLRPAFQPARVESKITPISPFQSDWSKLNPFLPIQKGVREGPRYKDIIARRQRQRTVAKKISESSTLRLREQ